MFVIREVENHIIKTGKNSSATMKQQIVERDSKKRDIYLQIMFLQLMQKEYFMYTRKCKASVKKEIRYMEVCINKTNCVIIFVK